LIGRKLPDSLRGYVAHDAHRFERALIVQRIVPPPATCFALMCAVWIAFYPVARLKRTEPWWAHWARGVVILFAFLLAQLLPLNQAVAVTSHEHSCEETGWDSNRPNAMNY
jgi:hypothetical protein